MTDVQPRVDRPVIDFDHHSPRFRDNWETIFRENLARCPVGWTESYGGFWAFFGYAAVRNALLDSGTYSSRHDDSGGGITIPATTPYALIPLELDPPESLLYRRLLSPLMSPNAAKAWEPYVRALVTECLDEVCETGELDVPRDFAGAVSARLTMALVGLPDDGWRDTAQLIHDMVAQPPGTPEFAAVMERLSGRLLVQIAGLIGQRRADPRDDLISRLATATVDGRALTDEEIINIVSLVIGGGVETTASLVAHAIRWLGEHPDQRQRLVDDPSSIPAAGEEFLRAFAPIPGMARTVTQRTEVGGAVIEPGEQVMLLYAAANRDPAAFDEPDEVRLDRSPNRHVAFGIGAHRCVGAHLARMQITVMLEAVLSRMPDITVVEFERYPDIAGGNGYASMRATFTPSARVGPPPSERRPGS